MRLSKLTVLALGIVSIGLFTGLGRPASAQPSQDVIGELANNEEFLRRRQDVQDCARQGQG